MKFKIYVNIITIALLVNCMCSANEHKIIGKAEFYEMSIQRQVEYINGLSRANKIKFIKEVFIDTVFVYPPNEIILFKNDGRIRVKTLGPDITYISYWEIKDNYIRIWKTNKKNPFPRKDIIAYDIRAENSPVNGKSSLEIFFLSKRGEEISNVGKYKIQNIQEFDRNILE